MASNTRKKTSKKKGPAKKKPSKATLQQQNDFKTEVTLWIVLAISIILFISNLGVGGIVGNSISNILFGIFGIIAYVFPIFLFLFVAFFLSNKKNKVAWIKILAGVILLLCLCLFFQLLSDKYNSYTPSEAFSHSQATKGAGGWIGGLIASVLYPSFGLISTYVIDIILILISFVLLTEKSIFSGMKKGSSFLYQNARKDAQKRRVQSEKRREQRAYERELEAAEEEKRRIDKKAVGVAYDTKIKNMDILSPSDEMDEFIPSKAMMMEPDSFDSFDINPNNAKGILEYSDFSSQNEPDYLPPLDIKDIFEESITEEIISEETNDSYYGDNSDCSIGSEEAPFDFSNEITYEDIEEDYEMPQAATSTPLNHTASSNSFPERSIKKEETISQSNETISIEDEIVNQKPVKTYEFPPIGLLAKTDNNAAGDTNTYLQETANKLQQTLRNFGVNVTVTKFSCGPSVTRFEIQPEMGVKVSKIVNLADDIKLNLAAADIRIEAPIPGKAAVGIEVPNKKSVPVMFRELIESNDFQTASSVLPFAAGKDIAGNVVITDIAKMPHLLIAGATGSGKSVCINTIIMSLLFKSHPDKVKLIMIDPKVVELSVYNGIPHLLIPVVTEPKKAAGALHWAVTEMTERYQKFAQYNVRDISGYNKKIETIKDIEDENKPVFMPHIVIIVDELADLMMVAPSDVEDAICRLAQLARAAGIHLVIATQRPSVNVITGLIKANMPSRIAFSVASGIDSRTILDMNGAEKLLGKGDMLFYPQGLPKPKRVQGAFVSDKEVYDVVTFLTEKNGSVTYDKTLEEKMSISQDSTINIADPEINSNERDSYFEEAARLMVDKEKGSIGMMQRYLKVGFNRAARIMDQLEEAGIVGPEEGTKPRRVLMSQEQLDLFIEENL